MWSRLFLLKRDINLDNIFFLQNICTTLVKKFIIYIVPKIDFYREKGSLLYKINIVINSAQ